MSGILGTAVTGAGSGPFTVDNSVRLRSSASAYMTRTPISAGNQQKFTYSAWVKRGTLSNTDYLLGSIVYANSGATNEQFNIFFTTSDTLEISSYANSGYAYRLITSQVFRDPSAWYHIVIAFDTTQATDTNRVKVYVNGSQITSFGTTTYPTQNYNTYWNRALPCALGAIAGTLNGSAWADPASYFDGYFTQVYFIDGQQLTASSFGETNASTGVWQPKAYIGTYGTNGFYLKFSDIATTSGSNAGLGKDFSGNGNYWNTNNISITSGSTYDSMTDVPTLTSATTANYAVLNPLNKGSNMTISNGNLQATASNHSTCLTTLGVVSGMKVYMEYTITVDGGGGFGVTTNQAAENTYSEVAGKWWIYDNNSNFVIINQTSATSYSPRLNVNDIVQCAIDYDTGKVFFGVNNTWISSTNGTDGNPTTGANPTFTISTTSPIFPFVEIYVSTVYAANFGQRPFSYTPPTGYVRLQTYNLPTPTIGASSTTLANKYFDAVLWTGNTTTDGVSQSVPLNFTAGAFWAKKRSTISNHNIVDVVRGANYVLLPNTTNGEFNQPQFALNTNAVVVTQDSNYGAWNETGQSNVGWAWKANGTGVTNTAGSITSTVSANTTSGFSIVTYTGNGVDGATVGHGLGVTPKWIFIKARGASVNWTSYHQPLGNTAGLHINTNGASDTNSGFFYNTSPSSTTFTLGSGSTVNTNSGTYVAYCFTDIVGYSKMSSYTGNGSTDGPFVYCGFRPRYVMLKQTNAGSDWYIFDTARNTYNLTNTALFANGNFAEFTGPDYCLDILSNGFKLRGTVAGVYNVNGSSYIYMAFAESPFNYSLAR